MTSFRHQNTVEVNGTGLDVEFPGGSKRQVPTTGTTDEDGIKDYIEFITALDMLDNERLAWLEDNHEVDEEIEGRWSETLEGIFKDSVSTETWNMTFDEGTRTPPPIKNAIVFDCTMRDYRDVLPGVDLPALVCAGSDEKWRTVAAVEYVSELLPNAEFDVFEDSGHCPFLEEPVRFNRVLENFIDPIT